MSQILINSRMCAGRSRLFGIKTIRRSRIVAFADLGMEAIHEYVIEDMPVTVAVDTHGESIHQIAPKIWQKKIGKIPVIEMV
jgi:fumarate hydratase, class I